FEAAAQRLLVARSTAAPRGSACAVLEENVRDESIAEIESMISTYVSAERTEVTVPRTPRGEDSLDLCMLRIVHCRVSWSGGVVARVFVDRVDDVVDRVFVDRVGDVVDR